MTDAASDLSRSPTTPLTERTHEAPDPSWGGTDAAGAPTRGLHFIVFAVLLFSLMAVCVKLLGTAIPTHEKILLRSIPTIAIVLWWLRSRGEDPRRVFERVPLLRGASGAIGLFAYYLSLTRLPMGNAVLLTNLSPVFAATFAFFFLREPIGRVLPIAGGLCLLGVAAISRPSADAPMLITSLALLGAASKGATYTLLRAGRKHPPLILVLALPLVSAPIMLVASLFHWVWPDPRQWLLIAGMTATSIAAQVFLTVGMRREAAGPASTMFFLGVILAMAFGQLLGDPALTLWDVGGVALIAGGLLLVVGAMRRRRPQRSPAESPP